MRTWAMFLLGWAVCSAFCYLFLFVAAGEQPSLSAVAAGGLIGQLVSTGSKVLWRRFA